MEVLLCFFLDLLQSLASKGYAIYKLHGYFSSCWIKCEYLWECFCFFVCFVFWKKTFEVSLNFRLNWFTACHSIVVLSDLKMFTAVWRMGRNLSNTRLSFNSLGGEKANRTSAIRHYLYCSQVSRWRSYSCSHGDYSFSNPVSSTTGPDLASDKAFTPAGLRTSSGSRT